MTTISDILHPRAIALEAAPGASVQEAIFHLAALLKEDERVLDWNEFYRSLQSKAPCVALGHDFGLGIPHVRTNAVSSMVMSVGRFTAGLQFPDGKVNYVFVIGVPVAMAADYLRIVGALARIFKNPAAEQEMHAATSVADFLAILTRHEMKL